MTSGVIGMRSHLSSTRSLNSFALNGITGDSNRLLLSFEDMKTYAVQLLEQLDTFMADDICDHKSSHKLVSKVCYYLKSEGSRLDEDSTFRQQLDLYFDLLRNILRKPKLSPFARTMILEVIELRASNWSTNQDIEEYYRRKMAEFEANDSYSSTNNLNLELQKSQSFATSSVGNDLSKSSSKVNKPMKTSGKTFLRDEVFIRNGDSGKVMGIKGRRVHLIEEMSDTVISFQKVTAGAKERLVQITGPSEENIERAKELIENTIKRNASPIPFECPNRSFDSNLIQTSSVVNVSQVFESNSIQKSDPIIEQKVEPKMAHTFNVEVDNEVILLSTNNYNLGLRAQQLLEQLLLKPIKENIVSKERINSTKRDSFGDSTSGDDLDLKHNENLSKTVLNYKVMAALNSASNAAPIETIHNRIQRSSSQGTVPIGRTSLRFMRCEEELHKSIDKELTPKITYDREFLMECSLLYSSKNIPNIETMAKIYKKTPEIIRKFDNSGENPNINTALHKSQSFTQNKTTSTEEWF